MNAAMNTKIQPATARVYRIKFCIFQRKLLQYIYIYIVYYSMYVCASFDCIYQGNQGYHIGYRRYI